MDDLIGPARPTLARVAALVKNAGLNYVSLGDAIVGTGIGVTVGEDLFSVISVAAGGSEGIVNLTIGVLKNIAHQRLAVLDECNKLTQDNASYPYFLHDAEAGWDVLLQVRQPIGIVMTAGDYFVALVTQLPAYAEAGRKRIAPVAGGQPYRWGPADCHRLLIRSLL